MIVNPWSVSALTVDTLSAGLAAMTLFNATRLLFSTSGKNLPPEGLTKVEDQLYLLFWMGVVLLMLRFLAWPLFYLVLHSFVPEVQGAMCIFGTRNLLPTLTRSLEILKPLLFFFGIIWLILFKLERFDSQHRDSRRGQRNSLILLFLCVIAAAMDSGASAVLWVKSSAELAVSCCTTITDIPTRFTVWMPESLLGPAYNRPLWISYFVGNGLVIGFSGLVYTKSWTKRFHPFLYLNLALLAVINCSLTVVAYIEVVAPQLMRLPFHHCLYCMIQKIPDASFFVGLFALGTCVAAAVLPVYLMAESWAEKNALLKSVRKLCATAVLCLSGSLLMVATHLIMIKV